MNILSAFKLKTITQDLSTLGKVNTSILTLMVLTMVSLSLYWQDTLVGTLAGVTGVICVFLVNMKKLSNFFWGTINAVLYGYVAYTSLYYGDTMLNWVFYLPIQFIGAYYWSNNMIGSETKTNKVSTSTLLKLTAITIITCSIYSQVLSSLGGNLSTLDSITTVLSILATYLMVKGYREQWLCWIAVNIISIYMWSVNFLDTGLGYGVLIMWIMFLLNSLYGTYNWFKGTSK